MLPKDIIRNPLFRLLGVNLASGALIGFLFALGLVALDAGQLRTLMLRDASGHVALLLLVAGFTLTCGGLSMATAVMSEASYRTDQRRKRPEA